MHRRQSVNAKTDAAPHGTLSLAMATRSGRLRRIRTSWSRSTRRAVQVNLRLDMLFSLTWTNAIALSDLRAADWMARQNWPIVSLGNAMAWAQWGAAILSTTKDIEMLLTLRELTNPSLEAIARWSAIIEIATKAIGLAYGLTPAGVKILRWRPGARSLANRDPAMFAQVVSTPQ